MLPTDHANSLVVICLTSCQLLCLPLPFISDKFVISVHEKASPSVKFKGPKTKPTMTNLHRQFAGSELEPHSATFSRNNSSNQAEIQYQLKTWHCKK